MNIKKRLEHLAAKLVEVRHTGSTRATAKAAFETGGVVLGANIDHANRIRDLDGLDVTARSMETNLDGLRGPFFMDHYAISQMFIKAANKIEELEKENARFTEVLDRALVLLNDESLLRIAADTPNLLDRASPDTKDQ